MNERILIYYGRYIVCVQEKMTSILKYLKERTNLRKSFSLFSMKPCQMFSLFYMLKVGASPLLFKHVKALYHTFMGVFIFATMYTLSI